MTQCPECRNMIPDDSAFCDQCGKELKWCPECKRPKRGTECPVCGNNLILGSKYLAMLPNPTATASPAPSALVGGGWRLALQQGQFGRRGGIWPELSSCQFVSGNHGTITAVPGGWMITDMGSTNGTYINGVRLTPGTPATITIGSKITIATIEFTVV